MNGTKTFRRIILSALALIVAAIMIPVVKDHVGGPGVSSDRSVGNYCDAWLNYTKPKGEEYTATVDAYKKAMANTGTSDEDKAKRTKAIEDVAKMFAGMPGDMAQLYDTVEKVAPSDIEPDVARAAQDAKVFAEQQRNVPTDLRSFGGGFLGQLLQSMVSAPTQQRIHDWNAKNCTNLQGQNDYFN